MTERGAKRKFLVVYDYGQGGVWAFVWARSPDEIHETFRDLEVVESVPDWLTGEELAVIEQRMTFDVENVEPGDWIATLQRSVQ